MCEIISVPICLFCLTKFVNIFVIGLEDSSLQNLLRSLMILISFHFANPLADDVVIYNCYTMISNLSQFCLEILLQTGVFIIDISLVADTAQCNLKLHQKA